mmetsp:Transcript_62203/g.202973  ORF Transcript_62203/g.202973 Transcript_62203/m.202973 type:complete len:337 (-) Transcript_62203:456-1466(-)
MFHGKLARLHGVRQCLTSIHRRRELHADHQLVHEEAHHRHQLLPISAVVGGADKHRSRRPGFVAACLFQQCHAEEEDPELEHRDPQVLGALAQARHHSFGHRERDRAVGGRHRTRPWLVLRNGEGFLLPFPQVLEPEVHGFRELARVQLLLLPNGKVHMLQRQWRKLLALADGLQIADEHADGHAVRGHVRQPQDQNGLGGIPDTHQLRPQHRRPVVHDVQREGCLRHARHLGPGSLERVRLLLLQPLVAIANATGQWRRCNALGELNRVECTPQNFMPCRQFPQSVIQHRDEAAPCANCDGALCNLQLHCDHFVERTAAHIRQHVGAQHVDLGKC